MYCEKCGRVISQGETICGQCGNVLEPVEVKQAQVSNQTVVQPLPKVNPVPQQKSALDYTSGESYTFVATKKKKDYRARILIMALLTVLCLTFFPMYQIGDISIYHNDILRIADIGTELSDFEGTDLAEEIKDFGEAMGYEDVELTEEFEKTVDDFSKDMEWDIVQMGDNISDAVLLISIPQIFIYLILLLQIVAGVFNLRKLNWISSLIGASCIIIAVIAVTVAINVPNLNLLGCIGSGLWAILIMMLVSFGVSLKK